MNIRFFICFLSLYISLTIKSQTMDIHYKNGFVQSEDVSQIDSLSFSSTTNGNSSINQIVNTLNSISSEKISHSPSTESHINATNVKDAIDEIGYKVNSMNNMMNDFTKNYEVVSCLFDWISGNGQENSIKRYTNYSTSKNATVSVDGNIVHFKGTLPSPYTFFNIGFDIPPTLYANESKKYVVLLTGSVKPENLSQIVLRENGSEYTELVGQDFEDEHEVRFQTLLYINYEKGATGNSRYVFFSSYPKDNTKDVKAEYKINRYCVFEYQEGWSISDYISCYDNNGTYQLKNVAKGTATESYVNEKIEKLSNTMASQSQYSPYSGNFDWDVNMIINYGQSLSVGGGAATINDDFRNTMTFPGGISEWASELNIDDKSQVENFYGNTLESLNKRKSKSYPPIASCALAWMSLLEKENHIDMNNFDYQFLMSTPGYNGIAIEGLSKAGRFPNYKSPEGEQGYYYRRLLLGVQKGMENAHKMGKTFGVPCVFFVQGETNYYETTETYYLKLKQLFHDLNDDIKAITGQRKDVVFITYQMSSYETKDKISGPTYAQLQLAMEEDNVHLGGPMYQFDYTDLYHPMDRAIIGLQAGIIAKRIINDEKPLALFYPKTFSVQHSGDTWLLSIQFDVPVPPMRFVTDIPDRWHNVNGKQKNYGFTLVKNGIDIIVEEPVIKRGNTHVIKCKQNPSGASLNYATSGHFGGGNLCDSQNITVKCKNIDYKIDNFCPTFKNIIIP